MIEILITEDRKILFDGKLTKCQYEEIIDHLENMEEEK